MERNCCSSAPIKRKNGYKSRDTSSECCCKESVKMFRVLVDPPSAGTFFSGSEVRGRVIVDTEEEKTFKYIHVSLTGRAQVCWSNSSHQREYTADREYLHETKMLWNREDAGSSTMTPGHHSFPFVFVLPYNIPSSFEGRVGWVRYDLLGRIVTGVVRKEHSVEIDIPVMEIVDINRDPFLNVPANIQVQKRVWSFVCTFANVCMLVNMSRTGFCVGEDIPLNVSLENSSRHEIVVTAILKQKITYTSKRNKKQFDKATVVRVSSHPIGPRTSTIWPTNLQVPQGEAPSQNYDPIHIGYRIKVVASVAWGQVLVAKIPITIGNIPYGDSLTIIDSGPKSELMRTPSITSLLSDSAHYKLHSQTLEPNQPVGSLSRGTSSATSIDSSTHNSKCVYSVQEDSGGDHGNPGDLESVTHGNTGM